MKNVWIDIDSDTVVMFDQSNGRPIQGWDGDISWGLAEAYDYAEKLNLNVVYEQRPMIDGD